MTLFVIALAVALVTSFLCSVSEATLFSITHAQIESFGDSRVGRLFRRFKRDMDRPIGAILVLNTVANTLGAAVAGAAYVNTFEFGQSTLLWFSLIFAAVILVAGEIIPKSLGAAMPVRAAPSVAIFVRLLVTMLAPVVAVTRAIARLFKSNVVNPVTSVEEIRLLASLGKSEGAVGPRLASMIAGATTLRELTAYDVMVPRGRMAVMSGARSLEENLKVIRDTGHSRFPYTPTGELDTVQGVLLTKDLLFQLRETPTNLNMGALASSALVVPETLSLDQLLRTFQDQRKHLAIVVDEYGGTGGLVTLEDVLEEIVGEIEDESDRVNPHILRRPDGSLSCRGWAEIRKICEVLHIDNAEELEVVTVGGLLAEELGRVPVEGDVIVWQGYRFEVGQATARRAERVDIREAVDPAPESPDSLNPQTR